MCQWANDVYTRHYFFLSSVLIDHSPRKGCLRLLKCVWAPLILMPITCPEQGLRSPIGESGNLTNKCISTAKLEKGYDSNYIANFEKANLYFTNYPNVHSVPQPTPIQYFISLNQNYSVYFNSISYFIQCLIMYLQRFCVSFNILQSQSQALSPSMN
jgi:hypothetical protein